MRLPPEEYEENFDPDTYQSPEGEYGIATNDYGFIVEGITSGEVSTEYSLGYNTGDYR